MPRLPRPRARFSIELTVDANPAQAWARLWELSRHTAAVPFTEVTSPDGVPLRQGSRFVARTGLGPLGLDDRMVVRLWKEPRHAVVEKVGPLLTGTIEVTVSASGAGSRVLWEQSYGARGVPGPVAALVRVPVRAGYARTLRRILG